MNRPNMNKNRYKNDYDSEKLGANNLYRRFKNQFETLLAFDYNEGTVRGRYYNKVDDQMRNKAYVSQKDLEDKLLEFKNSVTNNTKILVGFAGIGKTALIRNSFGITERKPFIDEEGNLIAYLSFYSKSLDEEVSGGLENVLVRYIRGICRCITGHRNFMGNEDEFFQFIDTINGDLLDDLPVLPGQNLTQRKMLEELEKKHKREYYMCLLKYYLHITDKKIKSLILIIDDIETTKSEYHIPIIDKSFNIQNCLSNTINRKYTVKLLLSMRAYTFRYNQARQSSANRVDEFDKDVITKETIPPLEAIVCKRFDVMMENIEEFSEMGTQKTWEAAKSELLKVINELDFNFGELITGLTHNNISRSMKIFLKILSNNKWFAIPEENENLQRGVIKISANNYEYYHKESVLKAMVYGEGNVYYDYEDNIVPNILHCHNEKCEGTELLGLYVLKYYYRTNQADFVLYGKNSIKGKDAVYSILKTFNKIDDEKMKKKLDYMMAFLYRGGLLLHSIYEPEFPGEEERKYNPEYELYLSLRALRLISIIENSSILLEFYRDDIDTHLMNYDKISAEMSFTNKIIYILDYIEELFDIEMSYINMSCSNYDDYRKLFGDEFLVSSLLQGVIKSVRNYYIKKDSDYEMVLQKIGALLERMNAFSEQIGKREVKKIVIGEKVKEYYYSMRVES